MESDHLLTTPTDTNSSRAGLDFHPEQTLTLKANHQAVKTVQVPSPSTAPSVYSYVITNSHSFRIHYSVMIISCPGSRCSTSN